MTARRTSPYTPSGRRFLGSPPVGRIQVSTVIDAPPATVWDVVRHIERHVDWMVDAEAIRFTSDQRTGLGTAFDCETRIGPLHLTDRMEITEWQPGRTMASVTADWSRARAGSRSSRREEIAPVSPGKSASCSPGGWVARWGVWSAGACCGSCGSATSGR